MNQIYRLQFRRMKLWRRPHLAQVNHINSGPTDVCTRSGNRLHKERYQCRNLNVQNGTIYAVT